MNRFARIAGWIGIGLLAGIALAFLALQVLTRTRFGVEQARRFAVGWLADQVNGELRIGRVTSRGLLGGVTIHGFSIHDRQGRPFLEADSLKVSYQWRTLLGGSIALDDAVLYSPRANIDRLPGDSLWNYQHIFGDTTRGEGTGARRLIVIDDIRIVNGLAVVRRPWEPASAVQPSDTARLLLEDAPGGLVELWRFDNLNGELERVIWESPIEEGRLIRVSRMSGRAFLFEDPLVLRDVRGTLTVIDSVVAFDFPDVRLPTSRAAVLGQVVLGTDIRYDVRIETPEVHFRDLTWLSPTLPTDAAGSMVLRIQSQQPKGILFLAENARITAPGTQMSGTIGVVAGDTLYFTRVDLRASPLDIRFLEALLPGTLPVDGLLLGTVEVTGPLSALETRGDVRYSGGPGAGSQVAWTGVFDVRGGARQLVARRLTADLHGFDLALLAQARGAFPLTGLLDGRVEASGRLDEVIRLNGRLRHQAGGRPASEVQATGTVSFAGDEPVLDLRLHAMPLALEEIAALSPGLAGLHGEARGDVRVVGPLRRLDVTAELETAAGPLAFQSLVARGSGAGGVAGTGQVTGFRLVELSERLPAASVSGRFGFDLHGSNLVDMRGGLRFDLDSARVGAIPLERGTFRGTLEDGLLRVDTLSANAPGVRLEATGEFGLVEGRTGTITAQARSSSLAPLEPVFFDDLVDPLAPRVSGAARADGTLAGTLSAFELSATARLDRLVYDAYSARGADVRLEGSRADGVLRLTIAAAADSLLVMGHAADSARASLGVEGGLTRVAAEAWRARAPLLLASGSARREGETLDVRVDSLRLGNGASAWALDSAAALRVDDTGISLEPAMLRRADGQGSVRAGGTLAWARDDSPRADLLPRTLSFDVGATDVLFADVLRPLRSQADAQGTVNGSLRVSGVARAPEIHGELRIEELRYENARLDQVGGRFDYAASRVDTRLDGFFRGRRVVFAEGRIPLDLRFMPVDERRLERPLEFSIQADSLPAALPLALFDGFSSVEGLLDGTVTATGTARVPELGGAFTLRRGAATWDATGVRYQDMLGTMVVEPDRIVNLDISARAGDPHDRAAGREGGARITGKLDLAQPGNPGFDFTLQADRLLAARRRDVDMIVSGEIGIGGRYHRPEITGNLRVDGGTLYLDELYRQYLIVGIDGALPFEVVDTSLVSVRPVLPPSQNPFLRNLRVSNASVTVGSGSWLRSREMNVEVTGELAIDFDRQKEDLVLAGSLNVVRGTYRFDYPPFARLFDVRSGVIEFPGTPGIDPNLDIIASYRARTQQDLLEIEARLSGTLQSPRVRLSSDADPPISESDLASYLFFGAPTYAFNVAASARGPGQGPQDSGFGRVGMAAFNAYGFGYLAGELQTLAQNFGLVDYVGLTAAETATGQNTEGIGGLLGSTDLEIGRYLWSPRTFIAWTQPLNSPGRSAGFRLEWRFHPTFTAELFAEDRFARAPSFGLQSAVEPKKVYGFFLFREWGY